MTDHDVKAYDALEAEGDQLCSQIRASGGSYPPRPLETKFSGAITKGPFDPANVVLALRDYVGELRQLAAHFTGRSQTSPTKTSTAPATAGQQPTPARSVAPGAAPSVSAVEVNASAKPKTATEVLLAAKGCTSISELAEAEKRRRNTPKAKAQS